MLFVCQDYTCHLTAHNWQHWKRVFLSCYYHETYRVDAVGLRNSNYTFKKYNFCEYVKFGAISRKIDILTITASLKFESENSFAQYTRIINTVVIFCTANFVFTESNFSKLQISLPNFAFLAQNHTGFSRKCLWKEQTPITFTSQNYRLK